MKINSTHGSLAMDTWKQSSIAGNLAFSQKRYHEAEQHYKLASQRAQQLLWLWFDAEEIITALVISFQNMAELYFMQSRHHDGLNQYQQLSDLLLRYQRKCDSEETEQTLALACQRAGTELLFTLQELKLESEYAIKVVQQFTHPKLA